MTIHFWSTRGKFGAFSNFSQHSVVIDHKRYRTAEHYYQSQKFATTDRLWSNKIAKASTPKMAAKFGRDSSRDLRSDWDRVKVDVMRRVLRAKAEQYPTIEELLLGTHDRKIVEKSPYDSYWGCGKDGKGENMLGRLWMEVRDEIRESRE